MNFTESLLFARFPVFTVFSAVLAVCQLWLPALTVTVSGGGTCWAVARVQRTAQGCHCARDAAQCLIKNAVRDVCIWKHSISVTRPQSAGSGEA